MHKSFSSFVLFSLILLFVSSCGKYEEGPTFTLLSKKARMVGTWELISSTSNGNPVDLTQISAKYIISKDGTYAFSSSISLFGIPVPLSEFGKWEFSEDKLQLLLTPDNSTNVNAVTILKLKNKELKTTYVDNGNTMVNTYSKN
jgi:putative alpha-1,2-mannosidase